MYLEEEIFQVPTRTLVSINLLSLTQDRALQGIWPTFERNCSPAVGDPVGDLRRQGAARPRKGGIHAREGADTLPRGHHPLEGQRDRLHKCRYVMQLEHISDTGHTTMLAMQTFRLTY